MMAAAAITRPTEAKKIIRAIAPETGGVRYPCLLCDTNEYSTLSNQEQMELFNLQEDILEIWETNKTLADKLKSMNDEENKIKKINKEMQNFFGQIPLGTLTATVGTQTDIVLETAADVNNNTEVMDNVAVEKVTNVKVWTEKEMKLQLKVIQQQKKLISDLKSSRPLIPRELWGHQSRSWPRRSQTRKPQTSSKKSCYHISSQKSSKPFSIPFCPQPLHLMVRKAYLKPPPKLPPLYSHTDHPTSHLPKCGSLTCDENQNSVVREVFANALERAVNSNKQTVNIVSEVSWADHPYYDNDGHEEDQQVDVVPGEPHEEVAWEDHPYYDDVDQETDQELDTPAYEEDPDEAASDDQQDEVAFDDQQDEAASDELQDEVAWEDHPYYDTPEEEHSDAESDVSEDVAWEDSPYY